jgi:outer membrane protein TolC
MTKSQFQRLDSSGISGCRGDVGSTSLLALCLVAASLSTGCAVFRPTRVEGVAFRPPNVGGERDESPPRAILTEGPLTLGEALEIALANNPDLAAGEWEVKAARARTRYARSAHWPSLDVGLAYRHNWHEERLVPPRELGAEATFSRDIFSADAVLKIPIFSGGRVVSAVAAQELLAESAEHRLDQTRSELVFNVKSTFYATLGQAKLIAVTERSMESLDEHLRVTKALFAEQKAAKVDLLNLEVRLSELRYELVKRRGLRELSTHLLVSLMGVDGPSEGSLVIAGDLVAPQVSLDRAKLFAEALEARPDMAAFDRELGAQAKLVDAARAEYWPVVSAQVTYGARLSAQGDADDLGFAGVDVSVPVLSAIGTSARVREERAKLAALQERRRKLAADIRREVESAVIQVETAIAEAESTKGAVAMARESLRIEREKAALGRGTAMNVLDAQAALQSAETRTSEALVSLRTSLALLELATGVVP